MDITRGLKQTSSPANSISFCPARHAAKAFGTDYGLGVASGEDPSLALLRSAAPQQHKLCSELLHTSLPKNSAAMRDILPQRNGFVHTVIEAYNRHRMLIIRPDDVWLAILTQFCFFVNGNAEALRSAFVAHEGKRELVVVSGGNRYTMDPAYMAHQMTELMQDHITDASLREWIMPSFTTTTVVDRSISAIVMMGTMKEYFSYAFGLCCGIPKVTLEGEKSDWEEILRRLERLKKYGIQTTSWYHLLRPIISRFVAAYDNPTSPENLEFWNKVAHQSGGGSGPTWLSGWITAFCIFDEQGRWKGNRLSEVQCGDTDTKKAGDAKADCVSEDMQANDDRDLSRLSADEFDSDSESTPHLTLDGFSYPRIDCDDIPCGYTYVDVKLDDNGSLFDTMFVAGSVGSQICCTKETRLLPSGIRDTVRPLPAWWYFIKGEQPPSEDTYSGISMLVQPSQPEPMKQVARSHHSFRQDVMSRIENAWNRLTSSRG
ncbi:hypothetical protein JVT61DRAFT_8841 [Boletus reticuloceps]|uniref:Uncharacterized protein n=1 Tax=Boletus reticuloceps TaxID=495285 RepID=A0A8I2YH44_9AGAM|nr:hypothetical protein JVT61DRAFT_8841 [Boletus reticuloceps]